MYGILLGQGDDLVRQLRPLIINKEEFERGLIYDQIISDFFAKSNENQLYLMEEYYKIR